MAAVDERGVVGGDPPIGKPPSEEDTFYLEWGQETFKSSISRLNELQTNLVTLSISLLGGSLVFYTDTFSIPVFKILTIATLLAGAIVSILGSIPEEANLDLRIPSEIRNYKEVTFRIKKHWYYWSVSLIYAGLTLAFLGFIFKLVLSKDGA